MGNERTAAATTTQAASAITTKTVNDDAVTFMDNDQQSMSTCQQQSLDELITESCNRMGIGDDRIDSNQIESPICAKKEHGIAENVDDAAAASAINVNHAMLQFDCDSFNLNDLAFCTIESNSMDLAHVNEIIPSMNEIFPQSIEILNALYDNASANNNDLQIFYNNNNASIPNSTAIASTPPPPPPSPPPPPPQQ